MGADTLHERIVAIARAEAAMGIEEVPPKSNQDPGGRIDTYKTAVRDSRYTMKEGDAYCAAFVSWVLEQAGQPIEHDHGSGMSYVPWLQEWAQEEGIYDEPEDKYIPAPGDVIITSENGERADHTGIVIWAGEDSFKTVEGNYNNGVNERTWDPENTRILGYFSPEEMD